MIKDLSKWIKQIQKIIEAKDSGELYITWKGSSLKVKVSHWVENTTEKALQ